MKTFSARISARVLYALTPLLKQASKRAFSDEMFYSQVNTDAFGCYVLPAEKGAIVCVVHNATFLAVRDVDGYGSEPLKVRFPDSMLDAVVPRKARLSDENGRSFSVVSEPTADHVVMTEGFGIVFLSKEQHEKYNGTLGSWFNNDREGYRDLSSYHLEAAVPRFVAKIIQPSIEAEGDGRAPLFDPSLFGPIMSAAVRLGLVVEMDTVGGASATRISDTDNNLFALVMPCEVESRKQPELANEVLDALTESQAATA